MTAGLHVERAGAHALVVDAGRFGYRHEGIAWSGAADALAYTVANTLVLTSATAPVIEIMLGMARFRFEDDRAFALTGAQCDATLDGRRCAGWAKHVARAGSLLELRAPARGIFTYLAVSGGFDVLCVLGSTSTDPVAGFGGWHGRALRANDRIPLCEPAPAGDAFAIEPPRFRDTIRVIPGGEFDDFDAGSRERFWSTPWSVGHESNRMGYRLHGSRMTYLGEELASHGVFPGVIQVPPSGEPIVLLSDAHTTGGYPKAGVVIEADLRTVAQARPGETLRFEAVDAAAARDAMVRREAYLQALRVRALERSGA